MSIAPANKISDISHMTPKLIIVHVTSLKMDAQILETQMNGRDTILIASSKVTSNLSRWNFMNTKKLVT